MASTFLEFLPETTTTDFLGFAFRLIISRAFEILVPLSLAEFVSLFVKTASSTNVCGITSISPTQSLLSIGIALSMSCQNIFLFTFLQCHGKVAFFETKMRGFIENKVKSCKTEGWRPSVQW